MLASGSVQQTPKSAHYASASSVVQSRLVRVVGEIIGLSLSASHQAAAQGGRQGSPPRQEALTQKSQEVPLRRTQGISRFHLYAHKVYRGSTYSRLVYQGVVRFHLYAVA